MSLWIQDHSLQKALTLRQRLKTKKTYQIVTFEQHAMLQRQSCLGETQITAAVILSTKRQFDQRYAFLHKRQYSCLQHVKQCAKAFAGIWPLSSKCAQVESDPKLSFWRTWNKTLGSTALTPVVRLGLALEPKKMFHKQSIVRFNKSLSDRNMN